MTDTTEATRAKAPDGYGSVYQTADGYWRFSVEVEPEDGKRRRKVKTSARREVVEAYAAAYRAANPIHVAKTRKEYMADARAKGTHTRAEMTALRRAMKNCHYCQTPLNWFNAVADHIVAVSRGGSDAIDNIQIICWECNDDKRTESTFEWVGEPRPFRVFPMRQPAYDRIINARRERKGSPS